MPVGRATLGRIINVIGEPIDERGDLSKKNIKLLSVVFHGLLFLCIFQCDVNFLTILLGILQQKPTTICQSTEKLHLSLSRQLNKRSS